MLAFPKCKRKIKLYCVAIFLFIIFGAEEAFPQCGCMGGASVGGISPIGGSSNIGILKKGYSRAISTITYSQGDEYYSGDAKAPQGSIHGVNSMFSALLMGYGITNDFTIDAELGYYINKTQTFTSFSRSGSGFSHITLYGKYNVVDLRSKEVEWSVGAGAKFPIDIGYEDLPQYVRPSNGAFGGIFLSFAHKGYKSSGVHLILINRVELYGENKSNYKYGENIVNSIIITKSLIERITGILELKSDIKFKDNYLGKPYKDSGWNNLILSPQINYSVSEFNFSLFFEAPVYRYYNGSQLTNSYNAGLSLAWQSNIFDE